VNCIGFAVFKGLPGKLVMMKLPHFPQKTDKFLNQVRQLQQRAICALRFFRQKPSVSFFLFFYGKPILCGH
jgi:hypothetical protein